MENKYFQNNNVTIYRFYTDLSEKEYNDNLDFFNSNFADLSYVPTVYWIEKGVPQNQLPILENNQYDILEKWISDNNDYY